MYYWAVWFCAGHTEGKEYHEEVLTSSHVRHNLNDLSSGDVESLRQALLHMEEDGSFEMIAKSVISQSVNRLESQLLVKQADA